MQTPAQAGAVCPSCERFIGPADVCPYCAADSARPPALRRLQYAAILLGVAGLAFLYLASARRELPAIRVADITPLMNFAYVRVCGRIERDAYLAQSRGKAEYVSFVLNDGSGPLRIAAYGRVAQDLVEGDRVPARGAVVEVAGTLNVSAEGRPVLRVQSVRQVRIAASGAVRRREPPQDAAP
jgi:hypothetical protein